MYKMGYHAITLGNHEFDYGVPRMMELLQRTGAPVVCANFFDVNDTVPFYAPYIIQHYGSTSVAFVGACTPDAMNSERYAFYDTQGTQHYDLRAESICEMTQAAVDQARKAGADYVVLLSHIGETPDKAGFSSHRLIAATTGIDAVLDGHTHSVIPHEEVLNRDGKRIPICQTGTQFANVGQLLIKPHNKSISTMLIPMTHIGNSNSKVSATIDSVKTEINKVATRKLGTVNYDLGIENEKGVCLVRTEESGLGDLVTDAFRHIMQAEIGLCNGGGIRNSISAGTITYNDATNALPYDNHMAKIEATGTDIRVMLETCTAALPNECGQFPQVSGMRYTIHQKSHAITDIEVLDPQSGTYQPIEPDRHYTIAVSDYYQNGGFYNTMAGSKLLQQSTLCVRDVLSDYITDTLRGEVSDAYTQPQGRITIVDD
jgi:2',3'-cyclic-nucleotide 2'-phosphodiesterase (5'-nucleotidase family)